MSETTRTTDGPKKVADPTAKSSQATVEMAGKAGKDFASETSQTAQQGINRAREATIGMTETAVETARAATHVSSKAAEQSREVLMMGVRTVAGVGSRMADISFGRGHHLLATAAHAMDIYREASERSTEHMQALFASYMTFGRGLQDLQHAWLKMVDHTMETAAHKPQDLLRCKNIVEFAAVQRDLYVDAVNHAVESTSRLLDIAGRTAQDAVRPLRPDTH
jgi:hypothetical protein